jgi:hypothetical protein
MKQNKLISYDKNAPTSWLTLILLVAGFTIFINQAIASEHELEATTKIEETRSEEKQEGRTAQIITTTEYALQQQKAAILADLRACESEGNDYAIGDGGASVGPFQWQKSTFEDKIGRKVTYEYYYDYVTDYERIYKLTEEVYFDQGETHRWFNCTNKIKHKYEII